MQTIKPSARPPKTTKIPDDIDDDFFDGTLLASSSKGKGKGKAEAAFDPDDSLPELPAEPSTPRIKRSRVDIPQERPPSSSPPPLTDYAHPHSEPMRKGVSKFDLRDDEWMMVEDEFLETAKLFTRHLHIAEYDRLKESIEAKKKEVKIARPVVAGAKRSVEGAMKERAKVQNSKQKKAIRDVFVSKEDSSEDDRASYRPKPNKALSKIPKPRPAITGSQDTDSDDLDAARPPKTKVAASASTTVLKPQPAPSPVSRQATSSFAKPALPATTAPTRPRARPSRITPFDMLDEYTPLTLDTKTPPATASHDKLRSQSTLSNHPSPPTSQTTTAKTAKPRRSLDLLDSWGSSNNSSGVSKEVADRIAKRKTEMATERDGKEKRRTTQLDDIPTFLF